MKKFGYIGLILLGFIAATALAEPICFIKLSLPAEIEAAYAEASQMHLSAWKTGEDIKSDVLPSTLNIPFTKENLQIFAEIGFRFSKSGEALSVPASFEEYVSLIHAAYEARGIPEEIRIYPGLVLKKGSQTRLYTPGIDDFPNGWEINTDFLRVKPEDMLSFVSQGRYPTFMGAYHDVWHIVIFLRNPEYLKAFLAFHRLPKNLNQNQGLHNRRALLTEIITLANPERVEVLKNELLGRKSVVGDVSLSLEHYKKAYSALSNTELVSQAQKLVQVFSENHIIYGAGLNRPSEYLAYDFSRGAFIQHMQNLVSNRRAPEPFNINKLASHGFHNFGDHLRWLIEAANGKLYETDSDNLVYMNEVFEEIAKRHPEFKNLNEYSNYLLADFSARLEYFLWETATNFPIRRWFDDLSDPNLPLDSPLALFLAQVLGEDSYTFRQLFPLEKP